MKVHHRIADNPEAPSKLSPILSGGAKAAAMVPA